MFSYERIHPDLVRQYTAIPLFDSYRLVDPREHRIYDYLRDTDELVAAPNHCYDVWCRHDSCLNCISKTCRALQKEMMKIEYLDGRVILIIAVPVEVKGRPFTLELAKDVTESFVVSDATRGGDNTAISDMILQFNKVATHDSFTGLYNKNFIGNTIDGAIVEVEQCPECTAERLPLLIEFDVDNFKGVNDTYGHSVGDDVLLYVAKHVMNPLEERGGWAGRFGGDEFILFMPNSSDANRDYCANVISNLSDYRFSTAKGSFGITVSCGVTRIHHDEDRYTVMDRVDKLMYKAKRSGTHWCEGL